jgi:hypothetical protein
MWGCRDDFAVVVSATRSMARDPDGAEEEGTTAVYQYRPASSPVAVAVVQGTRSPKICYPIHNVVNEDWCMNYYNKKCYDKSNDYYEEGEDYYGLYHTNSPSNSIERMYNSSALAHYHHHQSQQCSGDPQSWDGGVPVDHRRYVRDRDGHGDDRVLNTDHHHLAVRHSIPGQE